jgi:hypothetical protein
MIDNFMKLNKVKSLYFYKNINTIYKCKKTFTYNNYDTNGDITYKLILFNSDKSNYYFILCSNIDVIIKYDSKTELLYEISLEDYYYGNFKNFIFFDKKKIII